jgi:cell division septation protein DedD
MSSAYGEGGFYSIQIAAFKNLHNAMNKVNNLGNSGRDAFYRQETIEDKGEWYRVYIDRYESKGEAEREARNLRNHNLIGNYVIRSLNEDAGTFDKESEKSDTRSYSLHISSFEHEGNAENEVQRLMVSGYKPFLSEKKVSGKNWFQVYVGRFDDEKEA